MKITVMGSGGVGGYFGARLAAAGNDVTFVSRGTQLAAMRKSGLRLDSDIGQLHLNPVNVVADAREIPAADAIIFAVKLGDTEGAAESLKSLVGKGAVVYTFQNGVESTERIGRVVGPGAVVPGVARIAAHIIEPGVIRQAGNFARIDFAEADGKPSARTAAFQKTCKDAGIDANLCPNIGRELWMKFAMLAPHAAMTALTRGPIGPVRSNPKSRALLQSLVEETVAVGAALKTGVGPDDAAKVMQADRRHAQGLAGVDGARHPRRQAHRGRAPVGRRRAARQGERRADALAHVHHPGARALRQRQAADLTCEPACAGTDDDRHDSAIVLRRGARQRSKRPDGPDDGRNPALQAASGAARGRRPGPAEAQGRARCWWSARVGSARRC